MLLPLLTLFVSLSLGQQCPPENDVLPCRCAEGFSLFCDNLDVVNGLTNFRFAQILDSYLSAGITSLTYLFIQNGASLTALPQQLSRFRNMENIQIYTSAIRSIPSDSFNIAGTSGSHLIIRSNSELASIRAGAFKGNI